MATSLYDILEISPNASLDEVKRAYRRLALRYHPDSGNEGASQEVFQRVTEAYEILSDLAQRALYDSTHGFSRQREADSIAERAHSRLRENLEKQRDYAVPQNLRFTGSANREELEAEAEEVESVESNDSNSSGFVAKLSERAKKLFDTGTLKREDLPLPGPETTHEFRIDALESILGTTRDFAVPFRDSYRTYTVQIPAQIEDGEIVKVRTVGHFAHDDVSVRVRIDPHEFVERDGLDITLRIPITVGEVIAGASFDVPTLDGPVKLKIPAEWDLTKRLRLKGKGVRARRTNQRGDLYVKPYLVLPGGTNSEMLELARQLDLFYIENPRKKLPESLQQLKQRPDDGWERPKEE